MIEKMEKMVLCALSKDKKEIIERLMKLKCVQMLPPDQLEDYEEVLTLARRDTPGTYEYETKLGEISSALSALLPYEPKPGLFSKKNALSYEDLLNLDPVEDAMKTAASVKGIIANIAEVKSFQSADQFLRQSLLPWQGLDVHLDKMSSRSSEILLFTLPLEADFNRLGEEAASLCCYMESVSSDENLRYAAAAVLSARRDETVQLIKDRGGLLVSFPDLRGSVGANIAAIDAKNEQYEENLKVLGESLTRQAKDTASLKEAFDRLNAAITAQKAKQNLLLTEETFTVCGWVPCNDEDRVRRALEGYNCFCEYVPPENPEEVPVKFKNNKLIEPFECITEMYGFPNPDSVDPNPLIAPFFFVFFGMMLSDAGYGVVLLIAGWLISRMVPKDGVMYKLTRMISICGISTIAWGAIYGGWFGDIVTQVAKAFFGADVTIPALINPLEEPMTILIMSVAFGIVHLFVGMAVKAYLLIRRGHVLDAVFDVGFWYLVLGGLIAMLVGMVLAGSESLGFTIGMWAAILGGAGLLLTGGRDKPSIVGKLIGGLGSLYDITSYFSDILSYSRILALGLATGVIAMVVNILATMLGSNILGIILFVVIFLFGHALNLAINALGSYVHTSRLQYVEFFGKFYEGGGKAFLPFRAETKYHILTAKEEN